MNDRLSVRWLRVAFMAVAAALVVSSVMPLAGQGAPAGTRAAAGQANDPAKEDWIQLFNGRDLAGWTAKFAKHDLGVNLNDTVPRREWAARGSATTSGRRSTTSSATSSTRSRSRPTGLSPSTASSTSSWPAGPGWAQRNNGLMLHAPDPKTMLKDQDFPISHRGAAAGRPRRRQAADDREPLHAGHERRHERPAVHPALRQLDLEDVRRRPVGARRGRGPRRRTRPAHRRRSDRARVQQAPDRRRECQPRRSERSRSTARRSPAATSPSRRRPAPTDFRKIELLNLEGCTDPKASNYKSYFLKSNPKSCRD